MKQTWRSGAERLKIAADTALEALRLNQQCELETRLHEVRALLETARKQHGAALATIEDDIKRRQMETANGEAPTLALLKILPAVAGSLQIRELNVGENLFNTVGRSLARLTAKGAHQ